MELGPLTFGDSDLFKEVSTISLILKGSSYQEIFEQHDISSM